MSRAFSGTEQILVTPSAQNPANQGSFSIMALIKPSTVSNDHWVAQAYNASNAGSWGLLTSGAKFYNEGNFGSGNGAPVANHWLWACFTKASGSVKPNWYFNDLTAGTGWTTNVDGANVGDQSGPPVKIAIGGRQPNTAGWQGSIAAIAVFNSVLTQTQIQNAAASAAALKAASPAWGVLLNQASTSTAVTDLSGNGATQSSITGTSIDADEPPGWSYSLVTGPTIKVWNGSTEVAANVTVWNGTAEVAASLSSVT